MYDKVCECMEGRKVEFGGMFVGWRVSSVRYGIGSLCIVGRWSVILGTLPATSAW